MSLLAHMLGLLCGLGTAAMAPAVSARAFGPFLFGIGFGAAAWSNGFARMPDAVFAGLVVASVSALGLARPGLIPAVAVTCGALSAWWIAVLRAQQVHAVAAAALAVGVPVVSALLARRSRAFAPASVAEEALAMAAVLGAAVAAFPSVADGWRSAGFMNLRYETGVGSEIATWIVVFGCLSLAAGAGHSLWWRRR